MKSNTIKYIRGSVELADRIEPLWVKLNEMHAKKSTHFSDRFRAFRFEDRKKAIFSDDKNILSILVVDEEEDKDIGYLIVSMDNEKVGEIDSLYVDGDYRGKNIGGQLLDDAMRWLKENEAKKIKIGVAEGNEDVIKLYERYGFYPKVSILEYKG